MNSHTIFYYVVSWFEVKVPVYVYEVSGRGLYPRGVVGPLSILHSFLSGVSSTQQNGLLKDRVIVRGPLLDPSVVYKRLQPRIAFICESNDTYVTSLYAAGRWEA